MPEHTSSDSGTTPENQNQLRVAVEQLKHAVTQCLGEAHDCNALIAQIEGTISDIEQKTIVSETPEKARQPGKSAAAPALTPVLQTASTAS
jgi:hypothetical protein